MLDYYSSIFQRISLNTHLLEKKEKNNNNKIKDPKNFETIKSIFVIANI